MTISTIALIGATGNVGRKIIEIAIQRGTLDTSSFRVFASSSSVGKPLTVAGKRFPVEDLDRFDLKMFQLALFATEADISKKYTPTLLEAGATVIDTSSAYRLDDDVPLIVPPVNLDQVNKDKKLFAHANCVASPAAVVLKVLHDYAVVKRVVLSTYQSTSGAGKSAMDELQEHTQAVLERKKYQTRRFPRPIAFNVIPQVSHILSDGSSHEEFKITKEIQKIISTEIQLAVTSVRVPVVIGHCISMAVEFEKPIDLTEITKKLTENPSIHFDGEDYKTPLEVEGKDEVFVGRVRRDPTVPQGILLWLVSDNLRRGAALDAVEIAEKVVQLDKAE